MASKFRTVTMFVIVDFKTIFPAEFVMSKCRQAVTHLSCIQKMRVSSFGLDIHCPD
jgi:chorismate mutase